jgi:hypothetical protein
VATCETVIDLSLPRGSMFGDSVIAP